MGVAGLSVRGKAVSGYSYESDGVHGESTNSPGVHGKSYLGFGVYGESHHGHGVVGVSIWGQGVYGISRNDAGVFGRSFSHPGVFGFSDRAQGVLGYSSTGVGVSGERTVGYAVYGQSKSGYAAYFDGRVYILGSLEKSGGSFKIDHPLDPANKYLNHSFVESPDMKNIYDGVIVLDNDGEAEVELPDWFSALNKDFRYQLTAIGAPGPNLYIAEEISDAVTSSSNNSSSNKKSRFKVAGGNPGMKVSWHVTGIRKDPWANAHRIQVEEDKPDKELGYYIHPELYGQPAESGMSHLLAPEVEEELLIDEKPIRRQSR